MSISTNIEFRNVNDPKYLAAISTPEGKAKWQDDEGPITDRPGARCGNYKQTEDAIKYTNDEYGGWIVDLSKVPPGTTHVVISRG